MVRSAVVSYKQANTYFLIEFVPINLSLFNEMIFKPIKLHVYNLNRTIKSIQFMRVDYLWFVFILVCNFYVF